MFHRLGIQNKGLFTMVWCVVNRKVDSKEQQLVVLMDQTSWGKLGAYDHCSYANFTRVTFKAFAKSKEEEEILEEVKVEGHI